MLKVLGLFFYKFSISLVLGENLSYLADILSVLFKAKVRFPLSLYLELVTSGGYETPLRGTSNRPLLSAKNEH